MNLVQLWEERRYKLPATMLYTWTIGLSITLFYMIHLNAPSILLLICMSNIISSGCYHTLNLYADGKIINKNMLLCNWYDRITVSITVIIGLCISIQQRIYMAILFMMMIPYCYYSKHQIDSKERYLRNVVQSFMHIMGSISFIIVSKNVSHEELIELQSYWIIQLCGFWMITIFWNQPLLFIISYSSMDTFPQRNQWIWI